MPFSLAHPDWGSPVLIYPSPTCPVERPHPRARRYRPALSSALLVSISDDTARIRGIPFSSDTKTAGLGTVHVASGDVIASLLL